MLICFQIDVKSIDSICLLITVTTSDYYKTKIIILLRNLQNVFGFKNYNLVKINIYSYQAAFYESKTTVKNLFISKALKI